MTSAAGSWTGGRGHPLRGCGLQGLQIAAGLEQQTGVPGAAGHSITMKNMTKKKRCLISDNH